MCAGPEYLAGAPTHRAEEAINAREVREEAAYRNVRNFIGGEWEEAGGLEVEPVFNPATGKVIAHTPLSTREDVERAVEAAKAAFPQWAATPVVERSRLLFRYKMLLEEHFEELRDLVTLENGKDAVRFFTENKVEISRWLSGWRAGFSGPARRRRRDGPRFFRVT